MELLRRSIALAVLASVAGCTTSAMYGRFDAYGDYDAAPPKYAAARGAAEVKVFYGTAPAGFSLRENELKVEPGFEHRILGTVDVVSTKGCDIGAKHKADVVAEMRDSAWRHGGNAVIYVVSHLADQSSRSERCDARKRHGNYGRAWVVIAKPPAATTPAGAAATPSAPAAAPAPAKP